MTITLLKSKLHRVRITQAELYYEGSIAIDQDLLDRSGMLPYEKVHVVNVNNGARLETYTIPGPRGGGGICMNGPAARLVSVGDEVIVIAYCELSTEEALAHRPKAFFFNDRNQITGALSFNPTEELTL